MPDSLFCQPPVDESNLTKTPSPIRFSNRVPIQPNCPKQVNQEMIIAGLVESSCLLHPFDHPDDTDDGELPPPSVAEIAPLLDEFLDDPGHLRIFVPNNKELKFRIMRAYHDSPLGMRRGRDNTYHALARDLLPEVLREVTRPLSIKQVFTSRYRPRADGATERDLCRLRHVVTNEELPPLLTLRS